MKTHPDIGRTVLYDGIRCRIHGVSYSHRFCFGGMAYHLMPEGERKLSSLIQYVPFHHIAFDPPVAASCQVIEFSEVAAQNHEAASSTL